MLYPLLLDIRHYCEYLESVMERATNEMFHVWFNLSGVHGYSNKLK